jgi:hypothetical protein
MLDPQIKRQVGEWLIEPLLGGVLCFFVWWKSIAGYWYNYLSSERLNLAGFVIGSGGLLAMAGQGLVLFYWIPRSSLRDWLAYLIYGDVLAIILVAVPTHLYARKKYGIPQRPQ